MTMGMPAGVPLNSQVNRDSLGVPSQIRGHTPGALLERDASGKASEGESMKGCRISKFGD